MVFEWDKNKNDKNIVKHGIDFNDVKKAFNNTIILKEDVRNNYGEKRWIALGLLEEFIIVIVYTLRDKAIRLISARLANKKERKEYYEKIK